MYNRPVGAFSKSSRPYRSMVSGCPTVDLHEAAWGYGWTCVPLPRALGLRLWQARKILGVFFGVWLC